MQTSFKTPSKTIDLRSDTLTLPTEEMYERMRTAPLGDDSIDRDPTVKELEAFASDLLGKEASLFVPTCTMANLLAILVQTRAGEQIIVENQAHIYGTEFGTSMFTGAILRPVSGTNGAINIADLEEAVFFDRRPLRTALFCLETSHNGAGGTAIPLNNIARIKNIADQVGARMHLDGARMFNAAAALDIEPRIIVSYFDTISLCLSKGLSAPAGALIVGPATEIKEARRLRKLLGGTQRQIGIIAAAGLEALSVMRSRLVDDHYCARQFAQGINAANLSISASFPETNIVQVDVSRSGHSSADWVKRLSENGVHTRAVNRSLLRCVTYRHIDLPAIEQAVQIFGRLASEMAAETKLPKS